LKDAVRLLVYLAAVVLIGALVAPVLYWAAHLGGGKALHVFGQFDFEVFFHRALLISALILFWPLLKITGVRRLADLELRTNPHRWRDFVNGFAAAILPLVGCGIALIAFHVYSVRLHIAWGALGRTVATAAVVPWIEETFFRGLVLGIFLRTKRKYVAMLLTSGLFSIVHFLKAPEGTSPTVTWASGFQSIAHAFSQFNDPMLLLAGFTTLFLIGWVLADARIRTASLWLPVGLHCGWILGNGIFSRLARRNHILLPWLGRNLLVGLIPLAVICVTWLLIRLQYREERA
jgi:membrane protease YdiL (CAAX protease family)